MALTYYAGPGKAYLGTVGFQPDGVNGSITSHIEEKTTVRASAQGGELFETLDDQIGKLTTVPWDNWNLLPTLFPPYLGVTTAAGAGYGNGALLIGTDPFYPTKAMGVVTSDGRQYPFIRGAITKHPSMKLLPGAPLFSQIELTALGVLGVNPGTVGFLFPTNSIVETGGVDPDAIGFGVADYGQTHWTMDASGWGTIFGQAEAEDGWELVSDVKYNIIPIQKVSRVGRLASARFMLKGRLSSPNAGWHSTLAAKILAHTSGGILSEGNLAGAGALNLKLNGANGKSITLVNCEVKTAPWSFGGNKLNTDDVAFVTSVLPTANAGQLSTYPPSLIFSA